MSNLPDFHSLTEEQRDALAERFHDDCRNRRNGCVPAMEGLDWVFVDWLEIQSAGEVQS